MNIYVASSWRNVWQPTIVKLLRTWGHEVYDFHNPAPGNHGFHWTEIDKDWKTWDPATYRKGLEHKVARDGFGRDMNALITADACILVQPCGTSAHLELGWACGAKKKTAVLFPLDIKVDLADALGHSMTDTDNSWCVPCNGHMSGSPSDETMGECRMPEKLRKIEPELMSKMAGAILLSEKELHLWLNQEASLDFNEELNRLNRELNNP